jgi:DNA uptake protein ComE-like DNA-binding protein
MWKDFFHFTRSERLGTLVLLSLLVLLVVSSFLIPYIIPQQQGAKNLSAELNSFKLSLQEKEKTRRYASRKKNSYSPSSLQPLPSERFPFNPNELDSLGFISLGIPHYVTKNILNYRRKGGKFRKAEDFSKIYSLKPELYRELAPYIVIETTAQAANDTVKPTYTQSEKPKAMTIVELNAADTTALKELRGIGSYYAKQIVRYRRQLGGFVRPEQLLEVYRFRPETYEMILPYITIDTTLLVKININKASIERLNNHPYLNFYAAKSIYEHRRSKKVLSSVADLQGLPDLTPEILKKITPYLTFGEAY